MTTAVKTPSARVRSRPSGNPDTMMARTAGEAMAPPTPGTVRAASSRAAEVASPPASEAAVKGAGR